MLRKLTTLVFCVMVGIFFTSISFSQEQPVKTDDSKKEDAAKKDDAVKIDDAAKKDDTAKKDDKQPEAAGVSTIEAKSFFDGFTTYVNSKVKFKLSSTDNIEVEKIEYKIDGGPISAYQNPFSVDQEGRHAIYFYGIDKVGNKEADKSFSFVVDNTAPVVVFTASKPLMKIADKIWVSKDVTFNISAADALSGVNSVQFSVNGKDYLKYISTFGIDGTEAELKTKVDDKVNNTTDQFAIKISDEAGKSEEAKINSLKLSIDGIAPVVEIKADKELKVSGEKKIAQTDVKYSVTAIDNESGVAQIVVRIDGKGDYIPYKGEISLLTNGDHLIEAKAIDKTGNISKIATFSVFVDTIAPTSTIETAK